MAGRYAEIRDEKVLEQALLLAKGSYQEDILLGHEALSGATLRGRAKNYSGRYRQSAENVIARCVNAGLLVREEVRAYGKRVLVLG